MPSMNPPVLINCQSSGSGDILDINWNYDKPVPKGLLGIQCCAARGKPETPHPLPTNGPVWETADLTWWDFQRRRWQTLWLMKTIYYRLKRIEADTEAMEPGEEVEAMWNEVHEQNAREMKEHAEQAKGLFIKAGQVMSAMVGVLPDPYTREFLSLTDHLPVSSIDEVFRTIRRDLKRPPRDLFSSFDPEPIASASIAQVHKARLRSTGEVVAVKVQHEGVDRVFLEDVSTLSIVAGQVAFWSPDLDFRKFAEEWNDSLPHELDFHEERRALERAGVVLRKAGIRVIVPRVHKRLYGQHVFVMEFIEADPIMKLQDRKYCEHNKIDKHVVLRTLLDAFGVMAFKDGMFHADPHAGNVRIVVDKNAPGGATPVLFDWGLFREITDEERMGLAKAFHCLGNFDIAGLFDVLQVLGFTVRPELLTDDFRRELLEKARGVMKDTVNRETTRNNMRREMNEYKERIKANAESADTQGSYSPIFFLEDWPKCIIFFMRMLQILRGLCVAVDAEAIPILQIFAKHAREALMEGSQKQSLVSRVKMFAGREARQRRRTPENLQQQVRPEVRTETNATLEARITAKLKDLAASQRIVGAQVAVIQGGRLICSVAEGTLSTIDSRPVQTTTRFPLMGATPGIAALAALRVLSRISSQAEGSSSSSLESALRTPVTKLWPQFSGGNSEVTVADLLSHRAGVQDAFPEKFSPQMLDDIAAMVQHFEQVSLPSAREARYSYLLQAFIMTKLGDCMVGKDSLLHWLGDELGPLGLDIAAPAGRGGEATVCRDLPELARVSMNEVNTGRDRRAGVKATSPKDAASTPKAASTRTLLEALAWYPLVFDPLQANAAHGGMFRAGLSLGASAEGLASMMSSEALQKDLAALHALELSGQDPSAIGWMLTGGACQFTAGGLQVLQLQGCGHRALLASRQGGYGVLCGFGSCVAHFPDLAPGGVTVAVLVNDVLRGREAAAELVAEALSGYGYAPAWTSMPMRVLVDAGRLARSKEAEPLVQAVGGLQALKSHFDAARKSHSEAGSQPARQRSRCCGSLSGLRQSGASDAEPQGQSWLSRFGQWCASLCCCGGGLVARPREEGDRPPN